MTSHRLGLMAAAAVALTTLATPAAAATVVHTLSGVLPTVGAYSSEGFGAYSKSATYELLAPSFDRRLGALTAVTIEEQLDATATVRWIPILREGTSQIAIPPSIGVLTTFTSELRSPRTIVLGTAGAGALSSNMFALEDTVTRRVTTVTTLTDTAALKAFLSSAPPITLYRTLSAQGQIDRVSSGTATSNGVYKTTITYTYDAGAGPAVPEPATWALMLAGFGLAGARLRRRSAATA